MKILTRNTNYAVQSLIYLCNNKEIVSAQELSENLHIPEAFLRRILRKLSKAEIINSFKGNGGGFIINKKPEDIYLHDIIILFQGPFLITDCKIKNDFCYYKSKCNFKNIFNNIEDYVISSLKEISFSSLQKNNI